MRRYDALDAAAQPGAHRRDAELQIRARRRRPRPLAALDGRDDLVDAAAGTGRRVVHERGAGQALAHRRACGEDDQVAGLEAAGDAVEVLEAGRRAGDRRALARRAARACRARRREQVVDRAEVLAASPRGRPRGSSARRGRRARAAAPRGECTLRLDLVGGAQEPAQHRVLADDARVLADVADGGDRAGQQVDRGAAADALELAGLLEVLDERERVDRLADRVQVEHRLEDQAVRLAVEVLRLEALVDDQRRAARCPTAGPRRGPTARPRGSAAAAIGPPPSAPLPLVCDGRAHRAVESRSAIGRRTYVLPRSRAQRCREAPSSAGASWRRCGEPRELLLLLRRPWS